MFVQRYEAPKSDNLFYLNVAGGGYNCCIRITGNSVLPNCTGYAYGRFMECGNTRACNLSTGNAQDWYGAHDGYERGQTPKLGAVMCWNKAPGGKYGHVAVVEEIHADGSVTASMSNYPVDGKPLPYFERKTYTPPYNTPSGLPFQGFIYNPTAGMDLAYGSSDLNINEHLYAIYRQGPDEETVVMAAGINKVAPIKLLDADRYVMSKIAGANYWQMRDDQPDPYGTTYGDLSAPLNDVWTEVPNQNTTLFYDIETGAFGDCTGVHIDRDHNVFSPAVVYPREGNYQYALMVGINHVNVVSRYTFLIRFMDGTYATGIAKQDLTPKQIHADFSSLNGFHSIAFLDGGGSAQMGRWNGSRFEYVRDTGREIPSAVAIVSKNPYVSIPQAEPIETQKDEETPMEEVKPQETPEMTPVEGWKDPEEESNGRTIRERISALLSVKSILTLVLTGVFAFLVIKQIEVPEYFQEIYKVVVLFFFGYSAGKVNK